MAAKAINRAQGVVLMTSGAVFPVTNWLDGAGDEIDDAQAAEFAVVQGPDGRWHCLELSDFEEVKAQ